jgi:hypothetical protein
VIDDELEGKGRVGTLTLLHCCGGAVVSCGGPIMLHIQSTLKRAGGIIRPLVNESLEPFVNGLENAPLTSLITFGSAQCSSSSNQQQSDYGVQHAAVHIAATIQKYKVWRLVHISWLICIPPRPLVDGERTG